MPNYRVHFAPLDGDCCSIDVTADTCEGAIVAAIAKAKEPDNWHDPETCTRIDVTGLWRETDDHWADFQLNDGHWQIAKRIEKPKQTTATIGQILESLIAIANQAMRHEDGGLRTCSLSANEDTIELLETLGLVAEAKPEVWRWVEPLPDLAEIAKTIGR
jgi:hypothetical protein